MFTAVDAALVDKHFFGFGQRVRRIRFFVQLTAYSQSDESEADKKISNHKCVRTKIGFVCGANLLGTVEPTTLCFFIFVWHFQDPSNKRITTTTRHRTESIIQVTKLCVRIGGRGAL